MLYILLGILALVAILIILAAKLLDAAGLNKRCEGNENLKYLKAKNFDNLNAHPISSKSDEGQTLNGFLYSGAKIDKYKALIVFSHGMGAGHLAYTTEINYFAQKGYLVLAYDNTGTCESEGKKLKGFDDGDALLTGVETRSSSPVRILRNNDTLQSVAVQGLYPCGEGAGYAGGIISAAVDGIKCAEKIIEKSTSY